MTDQTTNFMSNAARMIGFTQGYESVYLRELRTIVNSMPKCKQRTDIEYCIDQMEKKKAMLELWWDRRHEAGVTSEALLAELAQK